MSEGPNISLVCPLAWVDPDDVCEECGKPAAYSDAWGNHLYCSQFCRDKAWLAGDQLEEERDGKSR